MIKIIASPEKLEKRFLVTSGFFKAGRQNYLYLNEIEGKQELIGNALLLRIRSDAVDNTFETKPILSDLDSQYVVVEGQFSRWDRDPDYYPNGSISVSRIFSISKK